MTKMMMKSGLLFLMALWSSGAAEAASRIVIEKNHSARVVLPASAGSVVVGNPDIADVTVVDSRTLYIIGRGFGRSSVSVTDGAGRNIFDADVMVGTPVEGGVTVFKGLKSTTLICGRTCIEQTEGMQSSTQATSVAPAAPAN
ncbi:pilus assembly protein N-terminal domain-containing protein [Asticcacaulis sp. DXS10W]|uniref:Pilus assembly protein N-terminal domain-containing protein n=1 Tax=Asticcacaulis currens TaxID=2984210 RepID=A0ABT5IAR1_9CAUL|nr:pilus assembly protein N-terminal domain-containing protein [Asticcacaulis currens]MDC7693209.1 pilus assembly protein N-terminal domain-containing protein [Asticcacaulis currens]